MKKIYTIIVLSLLASACSTFKPDYVVKEASLPSAPKWINQEYASNAETETVDVKNYRYFVDEATNLNKRLCMKSAEVRATGRIASELAQEITNKYQEIQESTGDAVEANDTVKTKLKEVLTQDIKTNLNGVSIVDKYWEKRAYLKELGAPADYVGYKCNTVVKMSKDDLADAIMHYKEMTFKMLDLDVKKIEKAIKAEVSELKETSKETSEEKE